MNTQESFNQFELRVDALDYIFVEWLVRNCLYCSFTKNLLASRHTSMSARDCIRERVRIYASFPVVNYSFLLSGAFLFDSTLKVVNSGMMLLDAGKIFVDTFFRF